MLDRNYIALQTVILGSTPKTYLNAKMCQAPWGALVSINICQHENYGAVAQMGERLSCTQDVAGSIPASSTRTECEGVTTFSG